MTLEELWRDRLNRAHRRYKEKAVICAALADECQQLRLNLDSVTWSAYRRALRLEDQALRRYSWFLRTYADLVVRGIAPVCMV
jgi:hypothetical protein